LRINPQKRGTATREVTTKGDDEVTFHLKRPQPYLLVLLLRRLAGHLPRLASANAAAPDHSARSNCRI
jgi:hypothetical protein